MKKKIELDSLYSPKNLILDKHPMKDRSFDFGDLSALPDFKGTHPAAMQKKIAEQLAGR